MRVPKTPKELAVAVRSAHNRIFFGPCQDLAREYGFHPGTGYDAGIRSVFLHPKAGPQAEEYLKAFKVEEQRINTLYLDFQRGPEAVSAAKREYKRLVHNAQATVDRHRYNFNGHREMVARIRSGEWPDWITEPTKKHLDQLEELGKLLSEAEGKLEQVKEDAQAALDARVGYLEQVMPGVSDPVTRREHIEEAVATFEGKRNRKGRPRLRELRKHANLPDITVRERNRACAALAEEG